MTRRIKNNKFGMTLLETMVVIFVIAVITGATSLAISEFLNKANEAANRISSRESIIESINKETSGGEVSCRPESRNPLTDASD